MAYKNSIIKVYKKISAWVIVTVVLAIIIVQWNLYRNVFDGDYSLKQGDWGAFGDYIGGIAGTVISLLAVYLIYKTYQVQKVELDKTTKSLEAQQHIQILFNLLERKDHIINDIEYAYVDKNKTVRRKGLHALWKIKDRLAHLLDTEAGTKDHDGVFQTDNMIISGFFNRHRNTLLVFYRSFCESIKYLDKIEASTPEKVELKSQLIDIYSANISNTERTLLNYMLQYYAIEAEEGRISMDRINRIDKCRERIARLGVINLNKTNREYLEKNQT